AILLDNFYVKRDKTAPGGWHGTQPGHRADDLDCIPDEYRFAQLHFEAREGNDRLLQEALLVSETNRIRKGQRAVRNPCLELGCIGIFCVGVHRVEVTCYTSKIDYICLRNGAAPRFPGQALGKFLEPQTT